MNNKTNFKGLSELVGWLSAIAFVLGVIAALLDRDIILPGNDYWQASLFLVLFAIFATLKAKG